MIALLAIPAGLLASHAAFASESSAPSQAVNSQIASPSQPETLPTTASGRTDTDAIHAAAQPLGECPELLEFLTSPEVNEFQTKYLGDPYTAETRFYPTCPDLDYMRKMYEAGRERVLGASE